MWVVFCGKIVVGIAASLKFEQAVQKKDQREVGNFGIGIVKDIIYENYNERLIFIMNVIVLMLKLLSLKY